MNEQNTHGKPEETQEREIGGDAALKFPNHLAVTPWALTATARVYIPSHIPSHYRRYEAYTGNVLAQFRP